MRQKIIEEWIVQRPGDSVRRETEEAESVACHFPIAEMPGDEHERSIREQGVHQCPAVAQHQVASPVVRVQPPR